MLRRPCPDDHSSPLGSATGISSKLGKPRAAFGARLIRTDFLRRIRVRKRIGPPYAGSLLAGATEIQCSLGRCGIVQRKREGDGATPAGAHRIVGGFVRLDKHPRRRSLIDLTPLRPDDAWCDDVTHSLYNRFAQKPFSGAHESLWRQDSLYDVLLVLDYNARPAVRGRGSAIFLHLAEKDNGPTAGCIALSAMAMRRLLPRLARRCQVVVRPG